MPRRHASKGTAGFAQQPDRSKCQPCFAALLLLHRVLTVRVAEEELGKHAVIAIPKGRAAADSRQRGGMAATAGD